MEAVPRLPMISFDLKVSPDRQPTDFSKLKQYIRDFYHEDPESYAGEIHKLDALRATAMRPAADVTGCSVLKKYYCQLHFLQSRFPMGKDAAAAVSFTWRDTYANMVCTLADIRFEIVSVLYNVGALHSQLGAGDPRSSSEGLKLACTHFQCAAWAFQHLKDTYPQPSGVDLAPDLMQFMYQVCLAQAQECILEKSMTDNRKATINAKVAAQIVDYYNMALNALSHGGSDDGSVLETVGSKLFKSWKRYVKFKLTYYGCIALLYQGQQSEEQQKMGERMAYYQAAFDKLVEATKLTKGLDHPEVIEEALTFTMDVVEGKRKAAKNENEFIYHEEVPDRDSLPEPKGAALVKGIPFNVTDPDISGPDIFGRLVPMKAHEASSLYSEEKAKLLRRMGGMVDEKDQELVNFISSLQLECVNAHLEPDRLPQDIVDRCAAMSAKPDAIQNLIDAMDKLSDIYHDVEAMLKEIIELIQNEEVEEREYQEIMGSRPPSIVATDLSREARKYEEAHNKAAESNKTLHKAMTQHIANLRLLELPLNQLSTQIPSLSALNLEQQPIVKEMQHLVGKVGEMKQQRAMLAAQLRESVCSDDITAQLVTGTGQQDSLETVFQEELQKHVKYVSLIEQNLTAQENIIRALTDSYAQYAPLRKATMELIRQRNLTLSALMSSYDAYEDLIAKTNKGQEFYRKLETNVTKLLQRVKGTCKVQQEERDSILANNGKTLPSKASVVQKEIIPSTNTSSGGSSSSGPKLKDYLESFKRDKSGGSGYSVQNPSRISSDPYYSTGSLPSQPSYPDSGSTHDATQPWVPSVRPAPVGQEGSCPTTISQDIKPEPSYPGYTAGYSSYAKPYATDGAQYPSYSDQYTSYMSQYQQYPATSSPYHVPAGYMKNEPMQYSKVATTPNVVNYPPNTPSPQLQGSTLSNVPAYSSPSPSPAVQCYPPSYEACTIPTTVGQMHSAPTTLPQSYTQQYPGQNYQQQQYSNQPSHGTNQSYPQPGENQPTNTHQYNSQHSNHVIQPYQAQNVPQIQQYQLNSATPQHNYVMPTTVHQPSNMAPQGTQTPQNPQGMNYHAPVVQSASYPSVQAYQNQGPTYPQPVVGQQAQPTSAVDDSISNNFAALQINNANITTATTYSSQTSITYPHTHITVNHSAVQNPVGYPSSQNPITYSTNIPSQENLQDSGQQVYPQSHHVAPNSSYTYPNPQVTQSALTQPANASAQYSSYIPEMYTSYINNKQYSETYAGVQPWQRSYDGKDAQVDQGNAQSYYSAQQYPNYSQMDSEMQYTPSGGASCYTRAGKISSQTSASTAQPVSQTAQPNYTQGNYYQMPYGYQYTSVPSQNITSESPSTPFKAYPGETTSTGQMTPQSPMTYMRPSNSNLKLTFSQETNGSTNCGEESSSNIDLLAGLDFSLSQDPLVPQQKAIVSPSQTSTNCLSNGVEEKVPPVPLKESATELVDATSTSSPVHVVTTPKKSGEGRKNGKFQLKDPFNDIEVLNQFVQEVEKFEKFVEGLTIKTLNGPTPLDIKWKELQDFQEKDSVKHSISVARCYPVKNRFADILPYDNSRVELPSTKDDYINASYVKDITPNFPDLIVTQLPLSSTFGDFWTMVLEQQVELVVCLLNDSELEDSRYWPLEKGVETAAGRVKLNLQSCNTCKHWVERIIYVTDSRLSRVVVHLQFTEWPGSSFPSSPGPFLSLVSEALSLRAQQRGSGPCVVHCLSGVGRAGLYLLTVAAICHIHAARCLPDLVALAADIASCRKNALRDREHFKFAYQVLLYYSQDFLMKRGILASRSTFEEPKRMKSHTRHPSEDFLLGPPKDVTQPQATPERKPSEGSIGEAVSGTTADPLNQLDPLWSLKK